MALHIREGFALPSEVNKDANAAIARRTNQTGGAFRDELEDVKRRHDADRAWNQHRSAKYAEEKDVA
jgi:hypothetical protein